jgi:hypothetical protein
MNTTTEELKRLQLAQARWRVDVAKAVLAAHCDTSEARDYQWKIENALYCQQLENAQAHLRKLMSDQPRERENFSRPAWAFSP